MFSNLINILYHKRKNKNIEFVDLICRKRDKRKVMKRVEERQLLLVVLLLTFVFFFSSHFLLFFCHPMSPKL